MVSDDGYIGGKVRPRKPVAPKSVSRKRSESLERGPHFVDNGHESALSTRGF